MRYIRTYIKDGEEERRRKKAVVAESTSTQAKKKDRVSVDETTFEHEYLLPEDEEIKEIDYSIVERDYLWDWEVWQARQQEPS
jgi:hypothetical protein